MMYQQDVKGKKISSLAGVGMIVLIVLSICAAGLVEQVIAQLTGSMVGSGSSGSSCARRGPTPGVSLPCEASGISAVPSGSTRTASAAPLSAPCRPGGTSSTPSSG